MKVAHQYAIRDPMELDRDGNYYCRHVSAMTAEGLHRKSDIAAELAWRDREIDKLRAALSARASAGEGGDAACRINAESLSMLQSGEADAATVVRADAGGVPLYTAAPQPAQAGASGGGGEVECPECKAALLYECVACSATNYPPEARNSKNLTTIMLEHADGLAAAAAALKAAVATRRECHVCQYDLLHDGPCDYTTPASPATGQEEMISVCSAHPVRDPKCPRCNVPTPQPATGDAATWEEEIRRHDATPPAHGDGEEINPHFWIQAIRTNAHVTDCKEKTQVLLNAADALATYLTTRPTPEAHADTKRLDFLLDNCAVVKTSDGHHWRVEYEWLPEGTEGPFAATKRAAIDAALALPAQGEG